MKIKQIDKWNDLMFSKHPTPYTGFAGLVEKVRIWKIVSYANVSSNDTVLEVGCEAGNLITSLPKAKSLTGFDISADALKEAKKKAKAKDKKIKFVQGDALKKLPFKKGDFSLIICSETLEHVLDPSKAIAQIRRICDKNTRVVVTVPNEIPKLKIKRFLKQLKIMDLIMPGIEDKQSEWHLHAFSRKMILRMLKNEFNVQKTGSIIGLHVIVLATPK